MPILAFLLTFILFAASSGLTYLSLRSWLRFATHTQGKSRWVEGHWAYACRSAGFALVTLAALIGAVRDNDQIITGIDTVSGARMVGYVLILISTPKQLRRRPFFLLAFTSLLLGEAILLLNASGAIVRVYYHVPLPMVATALMDAGFLLLWKWLVRTVLRVRLTDKVTLTLSAFSMFLMMVTTISVIAVIRFSLTEVEGIDPQAIQAGFQSLAKPIILLFVATVVGSAMVSFFLARNLIAPVNRMGVALRAIGRGDLNFRLRGLRSRDEMQDLALEINEMAGRLREADDLRAEFVSFASHELRNPLTAVKGFIETLEMLDTSVGQGVSIEERREIYSIVRSECERLLRMTDELLDTSRVEAGHPVALNIQPTDLRRKVEKVVGIMRTHTDKHTLSVSGPSQPVIIEADPDKFEQILINLLSNAIKYSPAGGPIEVLIDDKGNSVELCVQDQGAGMTAEQCERVFDKYYRIQDARSNSKSYKTPVVGTGIGLYLTRGLVNAHGGSIRVKSVPNEGSTFTVTLPKKYQAPPPEPVQEETAEAPSTRFKLPLILRG